MMSTLKTNVLRGVLYFHSETGSEGGHWSFQDEQFISPNTTTFACSNCHLYWDKATESEEQVVEKGKRNGAPYSTCRHSFELIGPESWSYDGWHVLKNGDRLKIFSKEDPLVVVWEGLIDLCQYELFTEHAGGLWIHADQIGISREDWAKWFFDGHRAELSPT